MEDWQKLLVRRRVGKKQVTTPNVANVLLILSEHPDWRGVVGYDEFAERVTKLRAPPWDGWGIAVNADPGSWTDEDTGRLVVWLSRQDGALQMDVGADKCEMALSVAARNNAYHPVRSYLKTIKWDGVGRLDSVLSAYFGAEDTAYTRAIGAKWMISAVARVMRPGCQADCTLILESPQGWRKTSAFRELVPTTSWYADSDITIGDKDSYQNLRGVWIYGLDELDSLKRSEVTKTKNFLTATVDRYRPSYGRRAVEYPRQNVFCGTTNENNYLVDATGNRRFWPVKMEIPAKAEAIAKDRDQLWAEAVVRFEAGERWYADTSDLRALCEAEQAKRAPEDEWTIPVMKWLKTRQSMRGNDAPVSTYEVLTEALNIEAKNIGKAEQMRVAKVLRALNYEKGQDSTGSRKRYFYPSKVVRGGEPGGAPEKSMKSN